MVMWYAAKQLSPEHFGKFSFALSLSFIAMILVDFGINLLLIREIARQKERTAQIVSHAFFVKFIFSIGMLIIISGGVYLLAYPPLTQIIVFVMLLFTVAQTFTDLCVAVFRAFEKMFFDALIKVIRMVLLTALAGVVLWKNLGVIMFSGSFVAAEIIVLGIALSILIAKFTPLNFHIDSASAKNLIKNALPFGMSFIFGSIYFYINISMLSKLRGDTDVAIYSIASNLIFALLFIPTVFTNALYPVFSRYYKESKQKIGALYERSCKYLAVIGFPLSAGIFMLAPQILSLLYGSAYQESGTVLKILAWFIVFKFINFLLGIILLSLDGQYRRMAAQGATALCNVILNLILIPWYGYIGAAAATLITELFLFFVYYSQVAREMHAAPVFTFLLKPCIAAVGMMAFLYVSPFGFFLTVIAGAGIYALLLFILKTFDTTDMALLQQATQSYGIQKSR